MVNVRCPVCNGSGRRPAWADKESAEGVCVLCTGRGMIDQPDDEQTGHTSAPHVPDNTTRWRDEPLAPQTYDDVAALVALARKARIKPVEFDWNFSPDDLRRLQRVLYERGRR